MSDSRPRCPLFPAALVVALMFAFGAGTVAAETADDRRLRQLAGQAEHPVEVKALLARGADPNVPDRDGGTALHAAASIGAVETMWLLLEAGGQANRQDRNGNTPLHFASDLSQGRLSPLGSNATIGLLLGAGANANVANRQGRTPLHLAAGSYTKPGAIHALIRRGADPNRKDRDGNTPLHAVLGPNRGNPWIVQVLLSSGADPKIVNKRGFSALQMFVALGQDSGDTAELLIKAGADPDRKWRNGDAPLHTVIRGGGSGKVEVAKALLAGGADPCVRDAKGYTPYQIAAKGGAIHRALDRAGGHDLGCDKKGQEVAGGETSEARMMQARTRSNVRSGPGTQHGKVGLLETGQKVRVIGEAGDWLRIEMPGGGKAFVYGPLLVEPPAAIVLEPKCGGSQRSQCWMEFANRPGCHFWNRLRWAASWSWSGKCDGGVAEGEGTFGVRLGKTGVYRDAPATISAGDVTLKGTFDVAKSPSDRGSQEPVRQDTTSATPTPEAEKGPLHGSIAFSQEADGGYAWGIAWRYGSRTGALAEARDQCREYGGSQCAEVGWFRDACGALAIGDENGYGAGWGATKAAAERDALKRCRASNANCRVEVARCSQSQEAGGKGRRPAKDAVGATKSEKGEPTAVLEPKCHPSNTYNRSDCWAEPANRPGCYFWIGHRDGVAAGATVTWSGSCSHSLADGEGILASKSEQRSVASRGMLVKGKKSGRWVLNISSESGLKIRREGPYMEGKMHGNWTGVYNHCQLKRVGSGTTTTSATYSNDRRTRFRMEDTCGYPQR